MLNTCITDQNWTDRPLSNLYIYIVIIETLINLEMVLVIQKKTIFLQLQEKLCPKIGKVNKIKKNILAKICGGFDSMVTLRNLLISINFWSQPCPLPAYFYKKKTENRGWLVFFYTQPLEDSSRHSGLMSAVPNPAGLPIPQYNLA